MPGRGHCHIDVTGVVQIREIRGASEAREDAIGSRRIAGFGEAGAREPSLPSASGEPDGLQQMLITRHKNA